ncbi:hypothetical protein BCR33DRAFT_714169 [Rhizoclosmatium globosum]|uniref:Nucleotide-diphospho-sugar transferase domain-containing protein n=1 Tax=Rhizoclosmatium globosum TaxID=329046 RepID=A0A1Y2CQK8_9FUNG|nr:hypothetical protein BCR33DRAFT_714169 [Rhizoclosmatium globosum]|eukprot:ORY49114.1 hypothetical protein BCR33DRAFT_714169 [Rhizoclosmatium globosum]
MIPLRQHFKLLIAFAIAALLILQWSLLSYFQEEIDMLKRSVSSQTRNNTISLAARNLPVGFAFIPPTSSHPPRKNAIMTLLSGPDLVNEDPSTFDQYCESALYHAYMFLHSPTLKLHAENETEFVVMMTPGQTSHCRNALLELGARVVVVPLLSLPGLDYSHRYHYTYTKYQMWALEGIYEKILFIDLDLLFVTKSPLPLFSFIDEFHSVAKKSTRKHFYGGVEDWNLHFLAKFGCSTNEYTGCINGGLLLLEPNLIDYKGLLEKMKTTRTGMADQYTLQQYFAYNSTLAPIILPKIYNTMWGVRGRTKKEVADAVGFHFKVLDSKSSLYRYPHPHVISHLWKHIPAQMMDLRRIQMDNFVAAKDKHHLPIIPVTLNNDSDTFSLHKLRTKYDRVTILAPLGGSKESLKSREAFAKHLHQSFLETARPKSLLETFRFIVRILDKYEWVWVVNPALRLTVDPKWPVHVMLDKLTKGKKDAMVLAFNDCEGKSGSFFVHKSAETILVSLVANVTEGKKSSDEEVWVKFWNLVKADAVIASEPEKLYQVEAKACDKGYYNV